MVKFGKLFRTHQIEEWKKDYIDYKGLKNFIKKMIENMSKDEDQEKSLEFNKNEDVIIRSPTNSIASNNKLNVESGFNIEESIIKFTKQMDNEIKKVYFFFVNRERELYVSINSHLHIRQHYETFNLSSIEKEFNELFRISETTHQISEFININMMALKKILRKFDKKFQSIFGRISLKYIQKKIECKNSDLLYILQFKIIDEVSALLEDLMCDLKIKFDEKKLHCYSGTESRKDSKIHNNNEKSEQLILNIELQNDFHMSNSDLISSINKLLDHLQSNIYLIDEHNQSFRRNFKEWNNYLKQNTKTYNSAFSVTNNTSLCGISFKDKTNLGYEQIGVDANGKKHKRMIRSPSMDTELVLSLENNSNIHLTLLHTFFFMMSFSIVIPTNLFYVEALGHKRMLSGLILACTPIGTLLAHFYTNKWIQTNYKYPMVLSVGLMVLGHLLYIFASLFESIIPMIIGRLIIGLGSNRVANRSYLIKFLPKNKLSKYLLYFQLSSLTGLATGPLLAIVLLYFDNFGVDQNKMFNSFTDPAWFCLLISIIFTILTSIYYYEPMQSNFTIYSEGSDASERSSSISSKDIISKNDKVMIENIDDQLSEINDKNQFSDTNLVARSIEQIAWREKKTTSYLYKCFVVFLMILVICRLTTESLLVISPYYIHDLDPTLDMKIVALLMSIGLFLVIPFGFVFNFYLTAKIRDRRMMIYLLCTCIGFNILILNLFYTSIVQYCIVFIFLIVFANLLENVATTMFSKIIPSDYELWSMNASFLIQISTTVGRIFGSLMLSLAGFATDENLNRITYGITLTLFVVSLVIAIIFYSDLRVKAIARILRTRSMRKLKNSEF